MANYVLNRNSVYSSTSGIISFIKGEPSWVPAHMEREVRAIGAECVSGKNPELLEPEVPPAKPINQSDRHDAIYTAFEIISERNDSKDFTGAGVPTVKAVEKITDFDVERSEIDEMWRAFRLEKAEADE